jgi:CelD/BcsL family acetyltransferase involved in cellulose biosynthesis
LKARLNAELSVVAVRRDGDLVGLFPLWRSRRRKVVRFLGEHVTDYLMPIVDGAESESVLEALSEHLRSLAPGNAVELIDIPSTHPFATMHSSRARQSSVCPRLVLPAASADLLQGISSNLRHSIRKGEREILQSGRGSFSDATESDWQSALSAFEALYASRAALKGRRTVLADPFRPRFWREFVSLAMPVGMARLKTLTLDGVPACGILCFLHRGTMSYYAQGMDPRFAPLAPGNLTLWRAVEDACAAGCHTFDFLRGEEEFKTRWRPELRHNVDVSLP